MTGLLLDTNALLRGAGMGKPLGRRANSAVENALIAGRLFFSAVSIWEITTLIRHRRLRTKLSAEAIWSNLTATGLIELPLEALDALEAGRLESLHEDPVDRLLVGTARRRGLTFVTSDGAIQEWEGELSRLDADA